MTEDRAPESADDGRWLWLGTALWLIAVAVRWPSALSMSDEVAYIAQAKLLLSGHFTPLADTPGIWHLGPHGLVAQCYPYLLPILISPLVAVNPRLVFVTGLAAALGIVWVASRALRAWGRRPVWALVVLAHPTVVLIARTVMADLALAAFAVGAWWAIRNDRRVATVILLVMVVGTKAVGFPIAAALVAGEFLRSWRSALAGDREARSHLLWAAAGLTLGLMFVLALNFAALGRLWYGYDHEFLGGSPFASKYVATAAPKHLATLLFLPPLLFIGARPFWRRREFGPLLVMAGITAMLSSYYFVDRGRNWIETMVISPRLILPAVAFLLIGYADVLACLADRAVLSRMGAIPVLIIAPVLIALAISLPHYRLQQQNAEARATAAAVAAELGVNEIGLTETAFKAGMLYPGQTPSVEGVRNPEVVLCGKRSASYRKPGYTVRCERPGYDTRIDSDGFRVLVRRTRGATP